MANKQIILYSTGCPQCKVLARLLDQNQVQYTVCNHVDTMMQMGITSVPMLAVDGKLLNMQQAMQWMKETGHED